MKTLYVYDKSWHAQLATRYGGVIKHHYTDTCRYWKAVLIGFLGVCSICIGFGLWLGFLTSAALSYNMLGYVEKSTVTYGVFIVTVWVLLGLCGLIVFFVVCGATVDFYHKALSWLDQRSSRSQKFIPHELRKTSFIKTAIESFRERYCVPMRVLDAQMSEEIRKALASNQSVTQFGMSVKDVGSMLSNPPTYERIKWYVEDLCDKGHAMSVKEAEKDDKFSEKYIAVDKPST